MTRLKGILLLLGVGEVAGGEGMRWKKVENSLQEEEEKDGLKERHKKKQMKLSGTDRLK